MKKPVIFIDGKEGTTGLQIYDSLAQRTDIELLLIDENRRKDPAARKECINGADLVFLCLPDAAAKEAVALIENGNTRVIDASTAHRTAAGWDYGFAELSGAHRAAICESKRVANPGWHEPQAQAPAGNTESLRTGPSAGVFPHSGRLL